jgi:DNA-binding winged helix-turn-helix (wHTH) protein/TolB-like protein
MTAGTDRPDFKFPVDLAREADFGLGASRVSPSTREVLRGAERETLEPRVMQVLVALFQANGRVVSRDELIARCWEGRIVGEDAINRAIGRLRRLSEVDREASFVIETIPRVGYRLVASLCDIPRPLVSELAAPPPGARKEKVQIAPAGSRRWLVLAALVLAGAAFVTSAAWLLWPARPTGISVAVLPFDTLDSNDATRVFGKAVAEQIVAALNDVQVQTVSRENTAALTGTSRDAAAMKLGAEFILNGSVQGGEKGLHVTVHLDHAFTHATVWTASYDQNGTQALEFQWQIAAIVSEVVQQALSARKDDPGEMNDAALGIYLKAVAGIHAMTQESFLEQRDLARQLIARAPKYAPAYSFLAIVSGLLMNSAPPGEIALLRADVKKAASQALALDSKNGMAYMALALLVPNWRWAEREAVFRKGLAVAPNTAGLQNYLANVLASVGRLREALALNTTSRMVMPQSPPQNASLARALVETGRVAEGISTINRAAKIWPSHAMVWFTRFDILANFGHVDAARAMLDSAQDVPVTLETRSIAAMRAYLDALRLNSPASKTAAGDAIRSAMAMGDLSIADGMRMFAKLRDVDTAFALAGTLFAPPDSRFVRASTAPLFQSVTQSMRRDPRFMLLAAKVGLVDYWVTTGKWPDFCSQPGLPYDCRAAARAVTPTAVAARPGH